MFGQFTQTYVNLDLLPHKLCILLSDSRLLGILWLLGH